VHHSAVKLMGYTACCCRTAKPNLKAKQCSPPFANLADRQSSSAATLFNTQLYLTQYLLPPPPPRPACAPLTHMNVCARYRCPTRTCPISTPA
jgi:hypothetical protein